MSTVDFSHLTAAQVADLRRKLEEADKRPGPRGYLLAKEAPPPGAARRNPTDGSDDAVLAPTFDDTSDPDFFIFTYRRTDEAAADANTTIAVEYGSNLTGWTTAVAGADIVITPTDDGAGAGIDLVEVKIRRTLAVDGRLFARLSVVVATP
jgi:hypothetical protein